MNHEGHEDHEEKLISCDEALFKTVLTAAIHVHKHFGPGLLESVYEFALSIELGEAGLSAMRQVEIPVFYRGKPLGTGFRADLIVENTLVVEVKAVETLTPLHVAQIMTYQRLLKLKRGFLLNFNSRLLKNGVRRISI